MKYIAVVGCQFSFDVGSGTVTPGLSSLFCNIDSKGIYKGSLLVSISGYTGGTVSNGSGSGVMIPTSICCKVDNETVLREGDKSVPITVIGTGSPPTTIVTLTITNANQIAVQCD